MVCLGGASVLQAQVPDTTGVPVDSLLIPPPVDSTVVADRPSPQGNSAAPRGPSPSGGDLQFTAGDSLIIQLGSGRKRAELTGSAQITAQDAILEAHLLTLEYDENLMRARGLEVDTGMVGRPLFRKGQEQVRGDELAYNADTQKGRIVRASTAIEDGAIFGAVSKQFLSDSTGFLQDGYYTTCAVCATSCVGECAPSYSLKTSKMKVTPNQIYTGPIHLRIFNIPTPFWLPFGILPPTGAQRRKSGPLAPNYGEDPGRGFYLRDWGWYFALNDYMDFQIRFGFWTLGSWQINPQYRYARRYQYSGRVSLDWVANKSGERGDPVRFRQTRTTRSFRWNHNQELNPTTRFTADVNLSSQSYLQAISQQYEDQVRQTVESNLNFNKRWASSGRSLTAYASHRQLLATGEVTSTLPRFQFTQSSRNPFKREVSSSQGERWYEKITYSFSSRVDNTYRFRPDTTLPGAAQINWYEALVSGEKYEQATGEDEPFQFKATHTLPVNAAFSIERIPVINKIIRLNVSPSFDYREDWYIRTDRRFIDPETGRVADSTVAGFRAIRDFSTGIGANSEFYGLFPLSIGRFQGLRHVVRPSLSFQYKPDFSDDRWGYYRSYIDTSGNEIRYPIASGISQGEQRRMSFSLNNVFQTKSVRVDTTGEEQSNILQLLTLNLGSSYNFAADSLKFAPVALSAGTRVLDKFTFNLNGSFSPYAANASNRPVNRYYIRETGWKPLRLRNLSMTARTTLRSKRQTGQSRPFENDNNLLGGNDPRFSEYGGLAFLDPTQTTTLEEGYTDFAIPWSLNLDFTYSLSKTSSRTQRRAVVNAGFDFNLTPNWKLQGRTGYDMIESEVVTTSVNILRDLGCWEMAFRWSPFGSFQSYQFSLNVKSGRLREYLRLRHPRRGLQNRFDLLQ